MKTPTTAFTIVTLAAALAAPALATITAGEKKAAAVGFAAGLMFNGKARGAAKKAAAKFAKGGLWTGKASGKAIRAAGRTINPLACRCKYCK